MRGSQLEVLVFANEKISSQIGSELRRCQPSFPWNFTFTNDAKTALHEARLRQPSLVVLHEDLPETTPESFARELLAVASEMSVFCFSKSGKSESHEIESLEWPPVSWHRATEQLFLGLPSETREKLGLSIATGPLAKSLEEYAERFRSPASDSELAARRSWIPVAHRRTATSEKTVPPDLMIQNPIHANTEAASTVLNAANWKPNSRIELGLLFGSILVTAVLWVVRPEEDWVVLAGLRSLSALMSGACVIGFFTLRALLKLAPSSLPTISQDVEK